MTRHNYTGRECQRRAPGCHNKDTCPAWGRYQAALAEHHAAERARIDRERIYNDYAVNRRKTRRRREGERNAQ